MFHIRFATDRLFHRLKVKNRHGVHSPFVYHLVDTVIYDFSDKKVYQEVENIRAQLIRDHHISFFNSPKLDQLQYRLIAEQQPETIIEINSDAGISTLYLQKAAPAAKVYVFQYLAHKKPYIKENFSKAGVNNIELISGYYDPKVQELIDSLDKVDAVFINGDYLAMLKYFEMCLPKVRDNTMLIFSGIYRDEKMKSSWRRIKTNPQVKVTIDLFHIGLVFFKQGQVKEDFRIRI